MSVDHVEERSAGDMLLQTGALYRPLRRLLSDRFIQECAPPAGGKRPRLA